MLTRQLGVFDAIVNPQPEAIVLFCSDPRFQKAFDDFLRDDLKLDLSKGQYVRIVAAGGSGIASYPQTFPKQFSFFRRRVELHCKCSPSVKRLILIGHEDCHWYNDLAKSPHMPGHDFSVSNVLTAARTDLDAMLNPSASLRFLALRELVTKFKLRLEPYFAKFADHGRAKVVFEQF